MSFHNIRLPKFIEVCLTGNIIFDTSLVSTIAGQEIRHTNNQIPKRHYIIKNCYLSAKQFEIFHNFFCARYGKKFAFHICDYNDCKVKNQIIGKGDNQAIEFQLYKTYNDDIAPITRKIIYPVNDTIQIYVNNIEISDELKNNISITDGKIILPEPLPMNDILSVNCTFHVPVRFNTDAIEYTKTDDGTIKLNDIELIEVYHL